MLRLATPMIVAMTMRAPTATNIPMKVLEELPALSEKEEDLRALWGEPHATGECMNLSEAEDEGSLPQNRRLTRAAKRARVSL